MGYSYEVDKVNGIVYWVEYDLFGNRHTPPMSWDIWGFIPPYSMNYEAAFLVVGVLEKDYYVTLFRTQLGWRVILKHKQTGEEVIGEQEILKDAICFTALLAKGVPVY